MIEVNIRDPLPVARAVLVDPNGVETAAYDIQRDRQVYRSNGGASPTVGVGVGGGSSGNFGTGIGIGFPIYSGGSDYRSDVTESTAKVKISNPGTLSQFLAELEAARRSGRRREQNAPSKSPRLPPRRARPRMVP